TVAVRVRSEVPGAPEGVFYLERGELVHAQLGEHEGLEAVRDALKLQDGPFRVDLNVKPPQRTIFENWNKLLLEETWRQDEEGRRRVSGRNVFPSIEEDSMSTTSSQGPHKAVPPSRELASRDFAVTVAPPFD